MPSVLPQRVPSVPHLSLLLNSAFLPFLLVISVQQFGLQGAVSSKLHTQHKAHSPMWSQEELWPSVLWKSQVPPMVISRPPCTDGSTCPQCFFLPWCICASLFLFKLLSVSVYHAFDVQIFLLKPAKWLICFCSLFTSTFLRLLCL